MGSAAQDYARLARLRAKERKARRDERDPLHREHSHSKRLKSNLEPLVILGDATASPLANIE